MSNETRAPRYATVEETIQAVRDAAAQYARRLRIDTRLKQRERAHVASVLDGICTALEVVTVNGNYMAELAEARDRDIEAAHGTRLRSAVAP